MTSLLSDLGSQRPNVELEIFYESRLVRGEGVRTTTGVRPNTLRVPRETDLNRVEEVFTPVPTLSLTRSTVGCPTRPDSRTSPAPLGPRPLETCVLRWVLTHRPSRSVPLPTVEETDPHHRRHWTDLIG